jgi:putative ABC transport system permease protein
MTRAFDLNLTALSLLALIFGMFLIYNTLTFSVVQRRPILGELRALGVTRREITSLVLSEAAVLGAMGTGLGLLLGIVLGRGLVGFITQTINDLYFAVSVESLSLPPMVFAKGALLGLGATVLASLLPALEAGLATPRSAMARSVLEEKAKRAVPRAALLGLGFFLLGCVLLVLPSRSILMSFGGLFGIVMGIALLTPLTTAVIMALAAPLAGKVMGVLGAMAARGVVAAMSRTAPAMAALVVAVSVTVGLGIMITSFRSTVTRWLDGTLQSDIYVSIPGLVSSRAQGTLDPSLVQRLTTGPGVDGFSTYRESPGNPAGGMGWHWNSIPVERLPSTSRKAEARWVSPGSGVAKPYSSRNPSPIGNTTRWGIRLSSRPDRARSRFQSRGYSSITVLIRVSSCSLGTHMSVIGRIRESRRLGSSWTRRPRRMPWSETCKHV